MPYEVDIIIISILKWGNWVREVNNLPKKTKLESVRPNLCIQRTWVPVFTYLTVMPHCLHIQIDSYILLRSFQDRDSALSALPTVLNLRRGQGREKFELGIPGLLEVFHHLRGSERALLQHSLSPPPPAGNRQCCWWLQMCAFWGWEIPETLPLGEKWPPPKPKHTSLSVSKLSSICTMLGCRKPRMISISRCRFLSSFSERPNFGMNFRATTCQW